VVSLMGCGAGATGAIVAAGGKSPSRPPLPRLLSLSGQPMAS
jgi:hypothetical protein